MTLYSTQWSIAGLDPDIIVLSRMEMRRRDILRTLLSADDGDALLVNGALGMDNLWIDLFFALAVRLRRRRVAIVVSDATWHPRALRSESRHPTLHPLYERFSKILLRAIENPHTHYCFLSRSEVEDFVRETAIDPSRVHFTMFASTIGPRELPHLQALASQPPVEPPYVFSGGNASRDYQLLAAAVAGTGMRVRVATALQLPALPAEMVMAPVAHDDFMRMLARCSVAVTVMSSATRRSGGQQTYLNAMVLGKPVVVTDTVGVRDHLEDGITAMIVPPDDPLALRAALLWAMEPANAEELAAIATRGQAFASTQTMGAYLAGLQQLLRDAAARVGATAA